MGQGEGLQVYYVKEGRTLQALGQEGQDVVRMVADTNQTGVVRGFGEEVGIGASGKEVAPQSSMPRRQMKRAMVMSSL